MQKKKYAVMDISSTYVTCVISDICYDGTVKNFEKSVSAVKNGSGNNFMVNDEELFLTVKKSLDYLKGQNCTKDIIVSISEDKFRLDVFIKSESFSRRKKIGVKDVINVNNTPKSSAYDNEENFFNSIISIDDSIENYGEIVQSKRKKVMYNVSFFYTEKNFLSSLKDIFRSYGYRPVFVAGSMIALNTIIPFDKRKGYYLAIDTDKDSTSFIIGHMGGMDSIHTINIGTNQIAGFVRDSLLDNGKEISYDYALRIVDDAVITSDEKFSEDPDTKIGVINYSTLAVNIVKKTINDMLGELVDYVYSKMQTNGPDYVIGKEIYLMGDGIAHIKGLKNYIENYFYGKVNVVMLKDENNLAEIQDSKYVALIKYHKSNVWQKMRVDKK